MARTDGGSEMVERLVKFAEAENAARVCKVCTLPGPVLFAVTAGRTLKMSVATLTRFLRDEGYDIGMTTVRTHCREHGKP